MTKAQEIIETLHVQPPLVSFKEIIDRLCDGDRNDSLRNNITVDEVSKYQHLIDNN